MGDRIIKPYVVRNEYDGSRSINHPGFLVGIGIPLKIAFDKSAVIEIVNALIISTNISKEELKQLRENLVHLILDIWAEDDLPSIMTIRK